MDARRSRRPVAPDDLETLSFQLGRAPCAVNRVAVRCPFAYPAIIENLPYDGEGRPFPTLFWATCPTLVAAVAAIESAGGVRAAGAEVAATLALRESLRAAVRYERRRRRALAARARVAPLDGGASLAAGIGGVAEPSAIKCLHAHAAHALARPGYELGELVLRRAGPLWCSDVRCAPERRDGR
jgi:hypothetical protein